MLSWFIVGIVLGLGSLALVLWLRNKNIKVKWYEWLLGILSLALLLFTMPNFFASFQELETTAAWMLLLILGLPAILLMVVAVQLVRRRYRTTG